MTPAPLVSQGAWQVLHLAGEGAEDLVISFASIGHDPSRPPSPEFVRSSRAGGRAVLFVLDGARSWGSAPGFAEALTASLEALGGRARFRRVVGIGVSMGAFTALRGAEVLKMDAVLAIGPQHRPWGDGRWQGLTAGLSPDLTAPLPDGPRITLLHGLQDDADQALAFPHRKGMDHLLFPSITHSGLAPHLKARGVMEGMIDAALAGDRRRLIRLATGAGGVRRQLPR